MVCNIPISRVQSLNTVKNIIITNMRNPINQVLKLKFAKFKFRSDMPEPVDQMVEIEGRSFYRTRGMMFLPHKKKTLPRETLPNSTLE